MFTTLIQWFSWLWTTIKAIWQGMWDWVKFEWTWAVGVIYAIAAISDTVGQFVYDQINFIAEKLGQITVPTNDLVSQSDVGSVMFNIGNTFFPLGETVTFLEAWSLVALTCLLYRFIKSWIPTVA